MVSHICKICNFKTKYKKDLTRHNETKKHLANVKETDDNLQGPAIVLQSSCEKMNGGNRNNVPKDNQDTNIYNNCKYCKTIRRA